MGAAAERSDPLAADASCFWTATDFEQAPRGAADPRQGDVSMIRKLKSGQYRLYSRRPDAQTGKRRNLGTFDTRAAAEKHERAIQYFKRHR
jgi:hypothetical protein